MEPRVGLRVAGPSAHYHRAEPAPRLPKPRDVARRRGAAGPRLRSRGRHGLHVVAASLPGDGLLNQATPKLNGAASRLPHESTLPRRWEPPEERCRLDYSAFASTSLLGFLPSPTNSVSGSTLSPSSLSRYW